ncbi:Bacterial regulatory protein, gntR family [Bifidobacterium margollesii]|uniref:Bacterial regulatory protein, gntR family n=1 Tax=Bifidobacterium margollesii TaxID=2020964 RepID=A0A2N5J725_9BIFI|nr:GntR family transcriptional regulator [Bifidobacterium margollesii]PLS30004.1 Bacterial regulatory protein, gntR family [Bifidobacterium margollesii]
MATAGTAIERPKPLRDQVYDRIIGLILDMSVKPGDSLTEPMLIKRLGVSRTPIREALLRLEAEGVLTSQLARGFRLKPLDRTEVEEIFPILASLEMLAIREMPDEIRPSTLKRLRTTAARLGSTEDPIQRWRLADEFHRLLAAEAGNHRLDEMTRQIRVMIGRYELAFMLEVSPRHRDADKRHDRIVDALERNERLQAARLDREHWDEESQQITHWLR